MKKKDEKKRKLITVYIPERYLKQIEKFGEEHGLTRNSAIVFLLREGIERVKRLDDQ